MQAAKRKVKGQAQKAQAKRDKQKELEAQKKQADLFGDSNQYDDYDQIGEDYEDAFCKFILCPLVLFYKWLFILTASTCFTSQPHKQFKKQANTETILAVCNQCTFSCHVISL